MQRDAAAHEQGEPAPLAEACGAERLSGLVAVVPGFLVAGQLLAAATQARFELRVTVIADGETHERVEAHEWMFDWSRGSDVAR